MSKQRLLVLTAAVLMVAAVGCNGSKFKMVPVSGTVTLDGEPLANAVVSFQPAATDGDNSGPGSSGRTDADGKFTLATQTKERDPGAIVGSHTVRISKPRGATDQPADVTGDEDVYDTADVVPVWYNLKTTLSFTVGEEGTDAADFALSKKPVAPK